MHMGHAYGPNEWRCGRGGVAEDAGTSAPQQEPAASGAMVFRAHIYITLHYTLSFIRGLRGMALVMYTTGTIY